MVDKTLDSHSDLGFLLLPVSAIMVCTWRVLYLFVITRFAVTVIRRRLHRTGVRRRGFHAWLRTLNSPL